MSKSTMVLLITCSCHDAANVARGIQVSFALIFKTEAIFLFEVFAASRHKKENAPLLFNGFMAIQLTGCRCALLGARVRKTECGRL